MEQRIRHWLQDNISVATPMAQQANWVAVDLFRHLGKGERPSARKVVREFSAKLADEVGRRYPHHWF